MKPINYIKPPNCTKLFEKLDKFQFTVSQNYNPVYERFFTLSPQNCNKIHLNHKYHIADITKVETSTNKHYIFDSTLQDCALSNAPASAETNANKNNKNNNNNKNKNKNNNNNNKDKKPYSFKQNIFVKVAPLLDPCHYLMGKYANTDMNALTSCLPVAKCITADNNANADATNTVVDRKTVVAKEAEKVFDVNNASYVDGFFSFLSNQLVESHTFLNGIRYYGSFLSVKKDFMFNIADDLEYLVESKFFVAHQNTLFKVEDYSHLIEPEPVKPRLNFDNLEQLNHAELLSMSEAELDCEELDGTELKAEANVDVKEKEETPIEQIYAQTSSHSRSRSRSNSSDSTYSETGSSISSRSSQSDNDANGKDNSGNESGNESGHESGYESGSGSGSSYESEDDEDEELYATIPQFPVQLICLEECVETLGDYLDSKKIDDKEWFAILMQVIMTLLVYQRAFRFTHNDLHTNNIMYVRTKQKFIYYRFANQVYRVPSYGKIYKIIDFGRAIFDFKGNRFCSDSFKKHGDAASQYNTEPYYDASKARIDPNYSFDLCRLACTIFDDLLEFDDECSVNELISKTTNPVAKLIAEWCTSDDGKNILYKNNGDERYPDFKLYKMIARRVNKHTPEAQLQRPEFKAFACGKNHTVPKDARCVNIDNIECYV